MLIIDEDTNLLWICFNDQHKKLSRKTVLLSFDDQTLIHTVWTRNIVMNKLLLILLCIAKCTLSIADSLIRKSVG